MLGLTPSVLISRLLILVIALTFHEFMHAFIADRLGDDTPRRAGRLTLNPLAHLDPIGSIMLILIGFGWAKPVPINPYNLNRHSSAGVLWVSLAGPASNLLLAVVGAIPIRLGILPITTGSGFFPTLFGFLYTFVLINLLLGVFNLIPISPLDGEKIFGSLLPRAWQPGWERFQAIGPIVLLALLFLLPLIGIDVIGAVMLPTVSGLLHLLTGV